MDTLEILREMRADPALAEDVRKIVLTEELLKLPSKVDRLVDAVADLTEARKRLSYGQES